MSKFIQCRIHYEHTSLKADRVETNVVELSEGAVDISGFVSSFNQRLLTKSHLFTACMLHHSKEGTHFINLVQIIFNLP